MNKIPPLDQNSPEAGFFKQTMNTFEAITARKSVRTFNGLKLDDNCLLYTSDAADEVLMV